jgi:dipeptidyl aminopeptidase/acylaminoacyl peptidase
MVENAIRMYQALTLHHVKAELLLLPTGVHGWGFSKQIPQKEVFEAAMNQFILQQIQ